MAREKITANRSMAGGKVPTSRAAAFGRFLRRLLGVVVVVVSMSVHGFAQQTSPSEFSGLDGQQEKSTKAGPRKQLAAIIFAGLGGAVLGLSTLSFYGRPQDKLSNIAIGFAIGVISGTVYVTYNAATNPREFYADRPWVEREQLMSGMHDTGLSGLTSIRAQAPLKTLNVGFTF